MSTYPKILDVYWFSNSLGITGIVRCENGKYYIGSIPPDECSTEEEDAERIAAWGSKFPQDAGDVLFNVSDKT